MVEKLSDIIAYTFFAKGMSLLQLKNLNKVFKTSEASHENISEQSKLESLEREARELKTLIKQLLNKLPSCVFIVFNKHLPSFFRMIRGK